MASAPGFDKHSGGRGLGNIVEFPFVRDKFYGIRELRIFEGRLRAARQDDPHLSAAIRARRLPWAKLWTEELLPMSFYFDRAQRSEQDEFRLMPEGDPVDAELRSESGDVTRFQITAAYAQRDSSPQGGYVAAMEREGVNQGEIVFLGGGTVRGDGGRIISEPRVLSPETDRHAWQTGLVRALRNKIDKAAIYAGSVDSLLVYAERLWFDLIDENPRDLILSAIDEALDGIQDSPFQSVIVIDQSPCACAVYRHFNSD